MDSRPIHRKILGQNIVLFRTEQGKVVALGDACPHRFAPLHQGKVKGDTIECAYHGLRFNGSGQCVFNPFGEGKIPAAAKVPAYRIEERNSTLWIWMGEPEKADPEQIIDTSFLVDGASFFSRTGCHPVKSNYLLVVDNLLDLTHAQFLHPDTVGGDIETESWSVNAVETEGSVLPKVWFEEEGQVLIANYLFPDNVTPLWRPLIDADTGDQHARISWHPASNLALRLKFVPGDPDEKPVDMIAMHFLTPIDELNTYYFYAIGWNGKVDNIEAGEKVAATVYKTIMVEDGPMIESCQTYMGETTDLFSLKPVLLPTDGMAVKARRRVNEAIELEAHSREAMVA